MTTNPHRFILQLHYTDLARLLGGGHVVEPGSMGFLRHPPDGLLSGLRVITVEPSTDYQMLRVVVEQDQYQPAPTLIGDSLPTYMARAVQCEEEQS